ncbi:DUF411 domain-containing protein [Colwellia sp. M166]|uniref:DUF411 domain-containing protein n=1 Tax=Colwellia sp. M166 TaxID=2583805 RepID=UPI00211F3DCA|nr:DUF411 domain-containing protein [Colwellia sp. M166]UUO24348.1 DUF411 domain-containing protein [Colwellia sp. M166]|tara:strand:- start:40696 stop:41220 length:525 start_codon:yes stop_codon:yes gene_type:complete
MSSNKFTLKFAAILALVFVIASCSDKTVAADSAKTQNVQPKTIHLEVYKSPTCGCCEKWLNHIHDSGFESKIHNFQDFSVIKEEQGIAPRYRSCHTAISTDGYTFEGHVPAKFIKQFLQAQHASDVIGLSVPAMPVGTPGMEVGEKFRPYQILLLKSDGSYEVYATIQSYKEQF